MIDPLLNLDTRDEAINQFNRLVELHGQAAVVLVNIVNVKEINTLLGHNTGDYALRFSAKVFREHLTNEDFVSRWRGESFVLTLPGQSLSEAKAVAEQIRFSLTITQVHGLDRQFQLQTTVAVSHSTHGRTLPAIITDAEKHLGQAGPKAFRQVILCEDARTAETTD
nr:GGDEF domain-containing protein [Bowmanella dokdonensis]